MTGEQFDAIMALLKKIVDQTAPMSDHLPNVYMPPGPPMPYTLTTTADSPTYVDPAVTKLQARKWKRIKDPRKGAK